MKRLASISIAALFAALFAITPAVADDDEATKRWRVTIENLTPAGSQPLSPPLLVVHSGRTEVWSVGAIASHGVAAIAEDANNAVLEQALPKLDGVKSIQTGGGGPILPGAARSFVVESSGRFNRLSVVTMLVNTNDAFTGLDSRPLSGRRASVVTAAYDAGSEVNDELKAHIPGPCCGNPFVRAPEGDVIRMHEGITGRGELAPSVYDWDGPAARITIERL